MVVPSGIVTLPPTTALPSPVGIVSEMRAPPSRSSDPPEPRARISSLARDEDVAGEIEVERERREVVAVDVELVAEVGERQQRERLLRVGREAEAVDFGAGLIMVGEQRELRFCDSGLASTVMVRPLILSVVPPRPVRTPSSEGS